MIEMQKYTDKIFIKDAYIKQNDAVIQHYDPAKMQLFLDKTVFYARSGGQPGDKGIIQLQDQTKIEVSDTIYIDDKKTIAHVIKVDARGEIEGKLHENIEVLGKIDWHYRYCNMRMHTALHLLCAVLPYQITGCQIEALKGRIDFNITADIPDKKSLAEKVNQLVQSDVEITDCWVSEEKLQDNEFQSRSMFTTPPKVDGEIRLVKIAQYDIQPCGGTHVRRTKEVGRISIDKVENKGAKNRRIRLSLT